MRSQTLTIEVPPALYAQLKQRAQQTKRNIEEEMVLALTENLAVAAALPGDLAGQLAALRVLDDETLWRLARGAVAPEDAARLAELGDKRQREGLTGEELWEAEALAESADRVLLVRAEAASHLRERGCDVRSVLADG